jgi:hypothetical protein
MGRGVNLYKQVVDVTSDYLGPAAERFIDRQIQNHLNKEPEALTPHDMPSLIDWLRISVAFLTDDRTVIDELTTRLNRLADKQAA